MKEKVKMIFVIGQPRCATTTLVEILKQHPNVFVPKIKEPHYFIADKSIKFLFNRKGKRIFFKDLGFICDWKGYLKNFNYFKEKNKVFIDGSTLYCVHCESIDKILTTDWIDPIFILNYRDKAKRAISHYKYSVSRGEELRTFEKCLQDEINGEVPNWLLKGFLIGSDTEKLIQKFQQLGKLNLLFTLNIDNKELNSNNLNQITKVLDLSYHEFSTDISSNENLVASNIVLQNLRLFAIFMRRKNPFLFDNILSRNLYTILRKMIKYSENGEILKDNNSELEEIYWKYWFQYKKEKN